MTVAENITLAPVELEKMEKDRAYQRAATLLKNIDLIERINDYPDSLSGGQQQRE